MDGTRQLTYQESGFKGLIGVSRADITPPEGIYARSWGAALHEAATGVHRPLTLTCISFQSKASDKPLILISADLCVWRGSEEGKALRQEILHAMDIPESHLMFCLSHTHSGPVLSLDDSHREGGQYIAEYLSDLQRQAISAARTAVNNSVEATLTWKYGKCDLATNRDLKDPSGDRYLVGFNPQERADDTLLVGRITDSEDKILGTIVNYACHPTTLAWENSLLSPDYVGAMREKIETESGGLCLFLQGASGELAPARQYSGDPALADQNGRQLGYAVLSVLEGMLPPATALAFDKALESGAPLAIWQERKADMSSVIGVEMTEISYKLRNLPSLYEIEELYEKSTDPVERERLWRKRAIRINLGEGETSSMKLYAWRLGDSILLGQPNEAYSTLQTELRTNFYPASIAVINLVNGSAGYLSPASLYKENIYPVWQSPFETGCLETLIETSIDVVTRLRSEI